VLHVKILTPPLVTLLRPAACGRPACHRILDARDVAVQIDVRTYASLATEDVDIRLVRIGP